MNTDAMFSSKSDAWATPQKFFDELNAEFHFNLDPCADSSNAKCDKFFTEEDDGLTKSWEGYTVFCNPPLMAGTPLESGLKRHTVKAAIQTQWWCVLSQQGRTPDGFTIMSSESLKSAL